MATAATVPGGGSATAGSSDADHEYTYDELLERIFSTMRQKNPDMIAGERRQMVIKPPQVHRLGTRRTAFANFTEYATKMYGDTFYIPLFVCVYVCK